MSSFTVLPAEGGLRGRLRVPGDKSISHRALLLSALAAGPSRISGLSDGADVVATRRAVEAFGARVTADASDLIVEGGDRHEPDTVIDVGNSGTGIRLMAGWAATLDGLAILTGDRSIARRPMGRVVAPLQLMGARIDGRAGATLPPLVVRGGHLRGIDYELPVPSAQVKGAVLLAGVGAAGPTTVREKLPTRAHTEQMLAACGIRVESDGAGAVTVHPGQVQPVDWAVPGDPSQAAFWVVAACLVPGSDLTVERVYVGPHRAGFLDVLRRMGADVELVDPDPATTVADIRARTSSLTATEVGGAEIPGLIDEIPALAVAASAAAGTTVFRDAAELRVKESDRIESMVAALSAVGVHVEGRPDGLEVRGSNRPLTGGQVDSMGDHRVAMSLAVAGLTGTAPVRINGWESVATSYPRFEEDMHRCQTP
ncbi:MAG: 3-phosphoshikimate 1-carboxyvinyltransferase [Acidobacteriota bacterium]|nr:3-phosphoshikimate 1-carboxyvinyltransferase [Acidobacteriota bacterium]